MSKAEILEHLAKLSPQEREEIRQKLDELEGVAAIEWLDDCDLTETEKQLLEQRLTDIEKNPHAGSSWDEVEARLRAKLSR
jgi:putative addiction module component (TIGR02574 family)